MKKYFLFYSLLFTLYSLSAQNQSDTLIVLNAVDVVAVKSTVPLSNQPVSYSFISASTIEKTNIRSLHDLSAFVPNFTMPDYGSKITSSIYVRGIGSRMNEPSVGLYVDDIPYLDKSAFDFGFYDIKNIEFLRGPQGTLYGRNAIGGLININTLSPFDYQGTRLFASYGNANDQLYRLSHYQKINDNLGFSAAGYYHSNDGFFKNEFSGKKDEQESFGGRFKLDWKLSPKWQMALSALYDNVSQLAYPYAPYDIETGKTGAVNYNEESSYNREIFNAGLTLQRRSSNLLFSSATSFQHLNDEMKMDNDFTPVPIFALTQKQKQNAVTQEFILKSNNQSKPYQWVSGAFGFYRNNDVEAPMIFREGALGKLVPNLPTFIVSEEAHFPGNFEVSAYGAALYHESSYKFWDKLTLMAGIRFEYEKTEMDYNTSAEMTINVTPPSPRPITIPYPTSTIEEGKISQDFWGILPKIAAKYDFNSQYNIYASVSRGSKTGGFNFQMFSNVLQQNLMNQMPNVPHNDAAVDLKKMLSYKPEYTLNYEIGTHSEVIKNRLFVDLAAFYIDYTDQQIVTFSSTNTGSRMMENAGRSESLGVEAAVRAKITDNLNANLAYGYTHATFKEYNSDEGDFAGNFVPLVPRNTFSVGADYTVRAKNFSPLQFLDNIIFSAQYNGLGKTYLTETNLVSQDFYGTLNGSISFEKGNFNVNFWTKNVLDEDYKAFYFTSLNNHFVQKGRPRQFGVSAQYRF
ncbi:MAG: TonB-dependent receptor [Prevotellaceae bacterium]|nr:TonB-dependent receptor [Prevotellaceae bacterium]